MIASWLLPPLLLSRVGFVVTPLTMPQRAAARISSMSAVSRKILMAHSLARERPGACPVAAPGGPTALFVLATGVHQAAYGALPSSTQRRNRSIWSAGQAP